MSATAGVIDVHPDVDDAAEAYQRFLGGGRVAKAWDEGKHPRGQPQNKGEFASSVDYRGNHTSPDPETSDPMHALGSNVLPEDMYDRKTQLRYYGTGSDVADKESFAAVNAVEGKPNANVTVYRGVPRSITEINPHDWVTPSKSYAEDHAAGNLGEMADGHVISRSVPAKELYTNGDSINEWGWHPAEEFQPLPRSQMPQLGGKPTPNTPSASLPVNVRGNVDLSPAFLDHLKSKGIAVTSRTVDPRSLKPSQSELNPTTVDTLANRKPTGEKIKPLWVSSDNHVIDGHHRWAADIQRGNKSVEIRQIDLPIQQALDTARKFASDWGVKQETVAESSTANAPQQAWDDTPSHDVLDPKYLEQNGVTGPGELVSDKDLVKMWVRGMVDENPKISSALLKIIPKYGETTPELFRGGFPNRVGAAGAQDSSVESWSTDRSVAEKFVRNTGRGSVITLPPGAAKGINVDKAIGDYFGSDYGNEHEWILPIDLKPKKDLADTALDQAQSKGGFSLNPQTGGTPAGGYMVALAGHNVEVPGITDLSDPAQRSSVKAALVKFVADNADLWKSNAHAYVGGWWDKAHGEFTLDPSENIQDKDQAVTLGGQRNQQAVWDVVAGEEIDTGGTGDRTTAADSDVTKARILPAAGGWLAGRTRRMGRGVHGPDGGRHRSDGGATDAGAGGPAGADEGGTDHAGGPQFRFYRAAHDVSAESRDAHGEWTAGAGGAGSGGGQGDGAQGGGGRGGGGLGSAVKILPALDLIAPHLSDTRTLPPLKGHTHTREVDNPENWKATRFGSLPAAYQKKILANVKAGSPNKLTPVMMRANLAAVFKHANEQHWEIPEGGKDADGHWVQGPDPDAMAGATWYNTANKAAWDLTVKGGIDIDHAVGMIASLSPQTDWDSNIAMANFTAEKLKADKPVQLPPDEIEYRHRQSMQSKGDAHDVTIPNGKRLSEMSSGQAAWALYAMAPIEGLTNGILTIAGKPKKAQLSMGAQNVAKAVDIYRGAEPDRVLSGHKVRSFYNNIMDPDDTQGKGDVTVDTHMVSAATGYKVTASGRTIKKMFEAGSDVTANVKGAYALFADAIRDIAHANGISPNKAQAIIWTHWQTVKGGHHGYREDFPAIEGDVPPKTAKVKAKEKESKARAAKRAKAAKEKATT